ncbi:hypothetical protein DFJ74DRAFT_693920 [Hyaloraphidium curvatum]|nr:hypothetical protein DFJ74DRAFT_693920 [Hyaloraphidium curvatum]
MPGQQVLERSSVVLLGAPETGTVEVRMTANLPAQGRTILGRQAEELLTKALPRLVRSALTYSTVEDKKAMADFVDSVEAQRDLRRQIVAAGLVAFVPDGAILPRASGASDLPLADGAVGFRSPPSLRRTFSVGPNNLSVSGMGLARGITLIVGGGYHGKSTLLQAIQAGVYDHVPGDGREFAVSDPTLFPVQSEDGRSVTGVNISPFIDNLPFGRSTKSFSTADASGSTSMAASIQEALELGCSALAVDEDTAATNFLIRDARMRMLVGKGQEPITPLISRARALRDEKGVSTILVIGGCGDYLDVADCVVQMQEYRAVDVTARAREIAAAVPVSLDADGGSAYGPVDHRRLAIPSQNPGSDEDRVLKGSKTRVRGVRELSFCGQDVDVSALTQLAETAQTRLVAEALRYLRDAPQFAGLTVRQAVDALERELDARGTDVLSPWGHPTGNMARCRAIEVAAALNRLRGLVVW